MAEKRINGRIVLKHDIESNWLLATGFTPMAGEIIIYDVDDNYNYERFKIGDGTKNVNDLPFYAGDWKDVANKPFTPNVKIVSEYSETLLAGDTQTSFGLINVGYPVNKRRDIHDNAIITVRIGETEWNADKPMISYPSFVLGQYNGVDVSVGLRIDRATTVYQARVQFASALTEDVDVYISYGLLFDIINEDNLPDTVATQEYVDTAIAAIPAPDVSGQIEEHNTSEAAHSDIREAIGGLNSLIGDKSVSEQINEAIAEIDIGGADWNQNDPDGAGYVTNRTHYVKEPVIREFYSYTNDAPSFTQHRTTKKYYTSINQVPYFTIGRTYLLTINGKEYEMVARDDEFFGNKSLSGSYENTGEDFLIRSNNIYFDGDAYPSTINILINEIYEEVIQLDEKFIGYKPGKIVAGQEYVIDVDGVEQTFVAGRGAEVFNDYKWNIAIGEYSHAEGGESLAIGYASHAEGYGSVAADGEVAHAEGYGYAFGYASHAEGYGTASCGHASHAEGEETEALYLADHAEGHMTVASGSSSHAEGEETLALEWTSHSEGYRSVATGTGSHAEGYHVDDTVIEVHISGEANSNTFQLDNAYDIEVGNLIVYRKKFNYEISYEPYDRYAFITNYDPATLTITTSRNLSGDDAIDGEEAYIYKGGVAAGDGSHIEGEGTFAMGTNQHVQGRYNVVDSEGKYAHIVGNGTSANRSNAHTVDWNGNAWFAGDVYVGGTSKDNASRLVKFSEIPEGSVIDESLTQSGQAADAKSTGDAINSIKTLVGDKKVSEQINDAVMAVMPKCTSITLSATNWTGNANPWSQVVAINGITVNSKIDLQPTAVQIVELQNNDIALMAENDDGVVTVYALGSKPTVDYTIQALITEVAVV